MPLEFEWDERKAKSNFRKHGVSFEEAVSALGDPWSLTIADPDHSEDEDRYIVLGESNSGRLIVIVATDRDDKIRIISARRANKRERRDYEEGKS